MDEDGVRRDRERQGEGDREGTDLEPCEHCGVRSHVEGVEAV